MNERIRNAALAAKLATAEEAAAHYRDLEAYTEVIQDGMLALLRDGVLRMASATSFSLSPDASGLPADAAGLLRPR